MSLSIIKAKVVQTFSGDKKKKMIPTVLEELVKSCGQVSNASLMDKIAVKLIGKTMENGLIAIDRSRCVGKFKIWCLHFMMIQKLLWPLVI